MYISASYYVNNIIRITLCFQKLETECCDLYQFTLFEGSGCEKSEILEHLLF